MKFTTTLVIAACLSGAAQSFVVPSSGGRMPTARAVLSVESSSLVPPVSLSDFMHTEGATAKSYEEHVQKTYG